MTGGGVEREGFDFYRKIRVLGPLQFVKHVRSNRFTRLPPDLDLKD